MNTPSPTDDIKLAVDKSAAAVISPIPHRLQSAPGVCCWIIDFDLILHAVAPAAVGTSGNIDFVIKYANSRG
jgi:hypothetical protein